MSGNSWSFHPKPQGISRLTRDMFEGLEQGDEYRYPSERILRYAAKHPGGWNTDIKLMQRLSGKTHSCASLKWAEWGKTPGTIIKQEIVDSGVMHPGRERYLSMNEIKILASFPLSFNLINRQNAVMRVGNCVPPNLMRAVAENLRQSPFLKETHQPTVISTFAGCGGSSLGYHLAGFRELLAVEWDDDAVRTFRLNFPSVPVYHGDIAKLSVDDCMRLAGLTEPGELDCFDGSPPCQGFSTAGKRKFDDPRNSLFKEYARLLKGLQPKCFVMENVTGMIKGHMKQAYLRIISELRDCGYVAKGQVLNAMYYNVPQSRERVIIVGVREDLAKLYL